MNFDINKLSTPYYIVDEKLLVNNLEILKNVRERSGCKILLAQKAFSMFSVYPLISQYIDGTTASGLFEARLGHEEMKKENHIFAPAYLDNEIDEILTICDHVVFNSFSQWEKYKDRCIAKGVKCGLRINPEFSTQAEHAIYDPCSPGSRLGITSDKFEGKDLTGISGLHFHTLCEQNSDDLEKTLEAVEKKFSKYFPNLEWINFGGGHHITREDYDIDRLVSIIVKFKKKYNLDVFLEPGEAVALNAGFLIASVLDIVENGRKIAILDASAACHMPDVLEMPYRPNIVGSGKPSEKAYTYTLGGNTCLAGDIIGEYSFDKPLSIGDRLVFCDMAIYSMVKNNTFNGICLPSIAISDLKGNVKSVKNFEYEDFKERLS